MIFQIIKEVAGFVSDRMDCCAEKMRKRFWNFVLSLGLIWVSVVSIFLSLCFFGFALYEILEKCVGSHKAPLIVGGFFMLSGLIVLLISRQLIKKEKRK